MRSFNKNFFS